MGNINLRECKFLFGSAATLQIISRNVITYRVVTINDNRLAFFLQIILLRIIILKIIMTRQFHVIKI